MNKLADAKEKFATLVDLLRIQGRFDITAKVHDLAANEGSTRPQLVVEFKGADTPLLIARNGELLHAIEHVAAKMLRLEPEEHDRISFDAANFKAARDRELRRLATDAIFRVKATGTPHVFQPMMSRERRLLHLALASSGLSSASIGERPHRSVVLYPAGVTPTKQDLSN